MDKYYFFGPLDPAMSETTPGVFSYANRRVAFSAQAVLSWFLPLAANRVLTEEEVGQDFIKGVPF